jgi:hypothetical protein
MHWSEYLGDPKEVVACLLLLSLHRTVVMLYHFLIHTPLDPSRLSIHSVYPPTLLETWSQQGLVGNSLCNRGREPLRSASRLLGFLISFCPWDPGRRFVASPSCGPRCLCPDPIRCPTTPGLFSGWHFLGSNPHRAPFAVRCLYLAVALAEGHGRGCRRSGPGLVVGSPLRWIPAGTSIINVG